MIIYIILIITSIKLYDYHFTKCLPIYLIGHYNQLDCIINHKLLRQYLYEIIYVPAYIIMPMYNNDQLKINSRAEEKPIAVYRPLIVNILHSFISIYVLVIGTHDIGRLETTSILGMIYWSQSWKRTFFCTNSGAEYLSFVRDTLLDKRNETQ